MTLKRIATALTIVGTAFAIYLGLSDLIMPHDFVKGFGLPEWPQGDAIAFIKIKGARELGMGAALVALLLARQHRALGWTMLAFALSPALDAMVVLGYNGSVAAAFGMHLATAAVMAVTGVLQLRATAKAERTATDLPVGAEARPVPGA